MPPIDFDDAVQHALQAAHDPESHVERDATTFHPSQIAMCPRQAYLSKLGLKDQTDALGYFQPGTLIHKFLEEQLRSAYPRHHFEYPILHEVANITLLGRADCYDPQRGIVYDVKTRGGWYNFDPPKDRHLDQLHAYMVALDADRAQVVYINKKDLSDVRVWPEWDDAIDREYVEFDLDRFDDLLQKADDIRAAIERDGIPESPADISFPKCGCYLCEKEALALPDEAVSISADTDGTPHRQHSSSD